MKPSGCKVMSTAHHSAAGGAGRNSTGQLRAWTRPGRPLDETLSGDRVGQEVGLVPGLGTGVRKPWAGVAERPVA